MSKIEKVSVYIEKEKIKLSLESTKEQVNEVIEKIKQCKDVSIGITRRASPLFADILKKHDIDLEKQGIQIHCVDGAVC